MRGTPQHLTRNGKPAVVPAELRKAQPNSGVVVHLQTQLPVTGLPSAMTIGEIRISFAATWIPYDLSHPS